MLAATAEVIRPLSDKLVAAVEGHLELQDVFHECNGKLLLAGAVDIRPYVPYRSLHMFRKAKIVVA